MQRLRNRVGLPGLAMAKRIFAVKKTELFTFQFSNIFHKYFGHNHVVKGATLSNFIMETKAFVSNEMCAPAQTVGTDTKGVNLKTQETISQRKAMRRLGSLIRLIIYFLNFTSMVKV